MSIICSLCNLTIFTELWEPYLEFQENNICQDCMISLSEEIYKAGKYVWWWIIPLIYKSMLESSYNRKNRVQIKWYREIFEKLKHKYNFQCNECKSKEELTIDHIFPVSKWWTDDIDNLQILCKSCNSKKSNHI